MSSFRCISYDYLSLNPASRDRVVNLHGELEQALAEALAPPAPAPEPAAEPAPEATAEPAPTPAPEPTPTQEEPASRTNRRPRRVTSNLNTILRDGEEFFINTCNLEWVFTWHTDTSSFIYNGVSYTTPLSICRAHASAHGAENPGNGYDFILRRSDGMTLGEIYDASTPTLNSLPQISKYTKIELFHKILDTKNGQIGLRDILTTLQGKGTGHRHTPGFPRKAEIIAEILRLQALS